MGQKTHPLGFRLGITQEHRSAWYANFNQYANLLEEDDLIRTYLNKIAKAASISNIKINRNGLGDQIQLNIETGRPGALVGENGLTRLDPKDENNEYRTRTWADIRGYGKYIPKKIHS